MNWKLKSRKKSPYPTADSDKYKIYEIDKKRSYVILSSKIQSTIEQTSASEVIKNILTHSIDNSFENIAVNTDFQTAESYFNFKILYKQIFKGATIKTTLYLNKIIEITR